MEDTKSLNFLLKPSKSLSQRAVISSIWVFLLRMFQQTFGLARLVILARVLSYRPNLHFDLRKVRELSNYGKWVFGSTILVFLVTQGDAILVGKLLGATVLGLYQLAYRVSNLPATEITNLISQVTFPVYSKIQDKTTILKEVYFRVLQFTAFISFPVAGLIFILAPEFTKIVLGEKWMPMIPAMQILVFAGLLRSISATSGSLFYGIGSVKIDTKLQIIRLFVLGILIYPFTIKWGLLGTSSAVLLSILVTSIGFTFETIKIVKLDFKEYITMLLYPFVNTTLVVLIVSSLKHFVHCGNIQTLVFFTLIAVLSYITIAYVFDKLFGNNMQQTIKNYIFSCKGGQIKMVY